MQQQKITPCLWFDNQAESAAAFYSSLFGDSKIGNISRYTKVGKEFHGKPEGSVMTVEFFLAGQQFLALNGGPTFQFNPSISFFVVAETIDEANELWMKLSEGGEVLMPLDKYEWSDRFGWVSDKFGVSWQIMLGNLEDVGQKITPLLFFTGSKRGKAEEAMNYFMEIFPNSSSDGIAKYSASEEGPEGMVKHAQCKLLGETFMFMDSGVENDFPFNEAISLTINCDNQEEVDRYWEALISKGGTAQQCGWLKDQFGISWQVVPKKLQEMLKSEDQEKVLNLAKALFSMEKLDLNELEKAF